MESLAWSLREWIYSPQRARAANYEVSPDGQRFVTIQAEESPPPSEIHVVLEAFPQFRARRRLLSRDERAPALESLPVSSEDGMPLSPGLRLGPYEIVSLLGAGGMGEVYKARDTRLGRVVALKILPEDLSRDLERRERFEREARAIASLSHPHICTLYDVGRENGLDFLVMEYLEGETLAERLQKGPLDFERALRSGIEVADALDRAHRHGVVHRDLKPGNVMLTKSGTKLLDFGLAKLAEPRPIRSGDPSHLETAKKPLTEKGAFLGTVQYMSPEQLEGRDADARSDLFGLGSVLYEMVTGRKAFEGGSPASIIAAILEREPAPMSSLQPMTPPALEHAVKTCLAKDPEARWQSAADLRQELAWVAETAGKLDSSRTAAPLRRDLLWKIATATFFLATVALFALRRPTAPASAVERFPLYPPEKALFTTMDTSVPAVNLAVSPDGRKLAFVASAPGEPPILWIRSLESTAAERVPGTEDAGYPFWSPDGKSLGFFTEQKLKRVDLSGGFPQSLADATAKRGGSWSRDGVILFAPRAFSELFRVPASGGTPSPVTTLDPSTGEVSHRWPQFLPDGEHFLFYVRGTADVRGVYAGSLDGTIKQRLLVSDWAAAYAGSGSPEEDDEGYLLFIKEGALMAQSFNVERLELSGDAFRLAEPVARSLASNAAFSISSGGVLAYWSGIAPRGRLTWFDRRGNHLGNVGATEDYVGFSLSPSQSQLAVATLDPRSSTSDIWLQDLVRGISSRITADPSSDESPIWSPNGDRLVFLSAPEGITNLYQTATGGGGSVELLFKSDAAKFPTDWSKDGRYILYQTRGAGFDLWYLEVDGVEPKEFLATSFNEYQGRFSPDGRSVAYTADESGTGEVYVRSFPSGVAKWRISTGGGSEPAWRRDGKELFYLASDGRLMSVGVRPGDAPFQAPQPLFQTNLPVQSSPYRTTYVVTGDGERFLVNTAVGEVTSAPITVVLHWAAGIGK